MWDVFLAVIESSFLLTPWLEHKYYTQYCANPKSSSEGSESHFSCEKHGQLWQKLRKRMTNEKACVSSQYSLLSIPCQISRPKISVAPYIWHGCVHFYIFIWVSFLKPHKSIWFCEDVNEPPICTDATRSLSKV